MTDEPDIPTKGGKPGGSIAPRVIALLNRLVGWIDATRTRRLAVYSAGSVLAIALIVGLRFGNDLPTLRDDLGALIGALNPKPDEPPPVAASPALPAPPTLPDPLRQLPPDLASDLSQPTAVAAKPFGRTFTLPPDRLCADLASMGFSGAHLVENPLAPTEWACDSDLVEIGAASAPGVQPSSIFLSMRGDRPDHVSLIRFKLNLTDPASTVAAKGRFIDLVTALHQRFHWDMPQDIGAAIEAVRSARVDRFGLRYDLRREDGEPPRLNLIITPSDNAGILATGAFQGPARPAPRPASQPGPASQPEAMEALPGVDTPTPPGSGAIENITQ